MGIPPWLYPGIGIGFGLFLCRNTFPPRQRLRKAKMTLQIFYLYLFWQEYPQYSLTCWYRRRLSRRRLAVLYSFNLPLLFGGVLGEGVLSVDHHFLILFFVVVRLNSLFFFWLILAPTLKFKLLRYLVKFPMPKQGWALVFDIRLTRPPTDALRPIIPDNACTSRITAAAGTKLAGAYSSDTVIYSSLRKGVYEPRSFFLHAALLRQAFAHCGKFLTAASRRSLGRVAVPMGLLMQRPWPFSLGLSPEGRLVISQSDSFSPRLRRGTSYLRFNNNWVIFNWNYAYQKHFFFFTSAPPRKESSFPPLIFMDICWSLLKQPSPRGGAYASYQEGEQISDCS